MKKYLLSVLMLAALGCSGVDQDNPGEELGATQQAVGLCVVAEISGSVGVAPPAATGFITGLVGSGTNIQVTYTPVPGPPVVSNIALGAEGGTVTGSWSGAKITSIEPVGNVLKVNGVNALTFTSNITNLFGPGTLVSWGGASGGLTQIMKAPGWTAGRNRDIRFVGNDNGAYKAADKRIQTTCTVSADYTIDANNNYVFTAIANDASTVEFWWGGVSLGTDSSPPFTMNATAGAQYGALQAKATFPGGGYLDSPDLRIPMQPSVAAGGYTSCASVAGKLYCWGEGDYGALANGGTADATTATYVAGTKNISKVLMHQYGGCTLDPGSNQDVSCWGRNLGGITGLDPAVSTYSTTPQTILSNQSVDDLAVGDAHACFLRNGDMYCWGRGTNGQLGATGLASSYTLVGPVLTGVESIAAGGDTTCAIKATGSLWCWGRDDWGQVGNGGGGAGAIQNPTQIGLGYAGGGVAVGYRHVCAYKTTGDTWCQGRNDAGQLLQGTSDASNHVSPLFAGTFTGITGIFSGRNLNTCMIQSGTLKCVGENTLGEMGNNTTSAFELTQKTATGFTSLIASYSIGGGHVLGFRAGHVYAWGDNSHGQIGNTGAGNPQLTPIIVTGL